MIIINSFSPMFTITDTIDQAKEVNEELENSEDTNEEGKSIPF